MNKIVEVLIILLYHIFVIGGIFILVFGKISVESKFMVGISTIFSVLSVNYTLLNILYENE